MSFSSSESLEMEAPPAKLQCPASTVNFAAVFAERLPHAEVGVEGSVVVAVEG